MKSCHLLHLKSVTPYNFLKYLKYFKYSFKSSHKQKHVFIWIDAGGQSASNFLGKLEIGIKILGILPKILIMERISRN